MPNRVWSEKCEENFEEGTQFLNRNFDRDLKLQIFESVGSKEIELEGS